MRRWRTNCRASCSREACWPRALASPRWPRARRACARSWRQRTRKRNSIRRSKCSGRWGRSWGYWGRTGLPACPTFDRPGGLSYLEVDLGGELHAAWGAEGADHAECRAGDVDAGVAVGLDQIEGVEGFQAKLQLGAAIADEVEILHQAGVHVGETGSADDAASGITGAVGVLRHGLEARGVEVGVDGSRDAGIGVGRIGVGIANHVGTRGGGTGAKQT